MVGADTVFISYSHDSPEHAARVLELSDKLRDLGVDTELDQYHTRPSQGWPLWCEERLRPENSKYVLTICTPTYRNRLENKAPADEGRGVYWEGSVVYQYIYDEKANERFIPVLLGNETDESIPLRLKGYTTYAVGQFDLSDSGFEALYRELTAQPAVIKRGLRDKVVLEPRSSPALVFPAPLPERPALTTFEPTSASSTNTMASGFAWLVSPALERNIGKVVIRLMTTIPIFIIVQYFSFTDTSGFTVLNLLEIILESWKLMILTLVILCVLKFDSVLDIARQIGYSIAIFFVFLFLDWVNYLGNLQKSQTPAYSLLGWITASFVSWEQMNCSILL